MLWLLGTSPAFELSLSLSVPCTCDFLGTPEALSVTFCTPGELLLEGDVTWLRLDSASGPLHSGGSALSGPAPVLTEALAALFCLGPLEAGVVMLVGAFPGHGGEARGEGAVPRLLCREGSLGDAAMACSLLWDMVRGTGMAEA